MRPPNEAFATLSQKNAGAVLVTQAIFFNTRGEQLARLAVRYRLPAIFDQREIAALGGLISYGTSVHRSTRGKQFMPRIRYSISSSAVLNSLCGMVRPSALAVLRLMTNSSLVALSTGRSPGFSPLRMRPA
jgi:hypothetical protein